jgi:hypothetical protein
VIKKVLIIFISILLSVCALPNLEAQDTDRIEEIEVEYPPSLEDIENIQSIDEWIEALDPIRLQANIEALNWAVINAVVAMHGALVQLYYDPLISVHMKDQLLRSIDILEEVVYVLQKISGLYLFGRPVGDPKPVSEE